MGILILAFVLIELIFNAGLSFLRVTEGISRSEELCIAGFAYSERGCIADMSNDPQIRPWHVLSFPHARIPVLPDGGVPYAGKIRLHLNS
jgi:hypothetical protein